MRFGKVEDWQIKMLEFRSANSWYDENIHSDQYAMTIGESLNKDMLLGAMFAFQYLQLKGQLVL